MGLPGWREYTDKSDGTPYYDNASTGVTQWNRPTQKGHSWSVTKSDNEWFSVEDLNKTLKSLMANGLGGANAPNFFHDLIVPMLTGISFPNRGDLKDHLQ